MLERDAFGELKKLAENQKQGWWFNVFTMIKGTNAWKGLAEDGALTIAERHGELSPKRLIWLAKMVLEEDTEAMHARLTKGKHAMLLHMVPAWEALRPLCLMGLQKQSRTTALRRLLLAEHCLEIETGRFVRKKRHERVCMACRNGAIGNAMRALSKNCVRMKAEKARAVKNILTFFHRNNIMMEYEGVDVKDMPGLDEIVDGLQR